MSGPVSRMHAKIRRRWTLERPKGITVLAVFYVVTAVLLLLVGIVAASTRPSWELMGTMVGARTFLVWNVLLAVFFLFLAHAFWRGVRIGFLAFVALKPAGWLIYLSQGVTVGVLTGIGFEALILAYVAHNRAWFRN